MAAAFVRTLFMRKRRHLRRWHLRRWRSCLVAFLWRWHLRRWRWRSCVLRSVPVASASASAFRFGFSLFFTSERRRRHLRKMKNGGGVPLRHRHRKTGKNGGYENGTAFLFRIRLNCFLNMFAHVYNYVRVPLMAKIGSLNYIPLIFNIYVKYILNIRGI